MDGRVGDDTLRALDEALLQLGGDVQVFKETPVAASEIVPGLGAPIRSFTRPAASSKTRDGEGASTTTGLNGSVYQPQPNIEVVSAVETLNAKRDGRSLGAPRSVHQLRVVDSVAKVTNVEQSDYSWGTRELPGAALYLDFAGFDKEAAVVKGEASYFGKFDPTDEGTGTPIFGTVQTNSSVFGISLSEDFLIQFGLAQRKGKTLSRTPRSHTALIEVYFPKLKRMVRAPIVDVGPKGSVKRPADLTVAVAAFLQDEPEEKAKGYKLKNIPVQLRVV